jgi:hypothetical protein
MFNTQSVRERESLSEQVDILLANDRDMKFLSFVNHLRAPKSPIIAQKHEWLDISARPVEVTSGTSGTGVLWDSASATADLPINSSHTAKLREGDILLLGDGLEQVIVKSVDTAANTIDVYARGHGSTDGAAQGETAFTIKIIGNAQIEDDDPIDAYFQGFTAGYNYTQIFEDVADQSGTIRRSRVSGGDTLDTAIMVKLKELMRQLNRACIYGVRNLDTTNKIGTMGGVREFFTTTKNINAALTLALLEATVVEAIDAGCNPTAIHASPEIISKISQLFVGNVRYQTTDRRAGLSVAVVNMSGLDIMLLPDRDVPSGEMLLVDHDRVFLGALNGNESGDWAVYETMNKNLKQWEKQVGGEFTMEVRSPAGAGVRAYGIN